MPDNVGIFAYRYFLPGDESRVISGKRTAYFSAHFPHTALRPVAPNGSSELFPRNKSNTTLMVVLSFVA